jgi:peptidoglycan hydrolase CwlO-like protein
MKKKVTLAVIWTLVITLCLPFLAPSASCCEAQVRLEAVDRDSKGTGLEEIEKKLKELIEELEKLRNDASQKLRKDLIPFLEKEIDRLKEWLRDFRLNRRSEPETRET